jgi:hypothetical protein
LCIIIVGYSVIIKAKTEAGMIRIFSFIYPLQSCMMYDIVCAIKIIKVIEV